MNKTNSQQDFTVWFTYPNSMEKISLRGWLDPRVRKLEVQVRKGNCKFNLTREISSSAGWQMRSLVRISGIKNGKEKKRNPRKEWSRKKESTSLCQFWNRRRVPMWIFLTSFDDESREDFWVWQMKSLVKISYLKMERKGSGIPGRKEAEGSASSTPWKYMARTRKVLHYVISEEEST